MAKVSVLMSVYSDDRYLREAVDSILNQTFTDFEFIIVDDGSTDSTCEILAGYVIQDPRIVLIRNQENIGQTKSLNKGLARAQGEYIARQDADDVSMPERLSAQVAFLKDNPDVGLLGSAYHIIDAEGHLLYTVQPPCAPDEVGRTLPEWNCICHGAALYRRQCLTSVGLYRELFAPTEDYDLWLRIAERFRVANLSDVLYRYRIRPGSLSIRQPELQLARARLARDLSRRRQRYGQERVPLDEDGVLSLDSLPAPEPRALARRYLWYACLFYLSGDEDAAIAHFASATAADASLGDDGSPLSDWLLRHAITIASQTGSYGAGARFISTVLSDSHGSIARLHRLEKKTLGRFHVAAAFEGYAEGDMRLVRRHLAAALYHDRQWSRNTGVLSIGLEGLVGRRAAGLARRVVGAWRRHGTVDNAQG